MKCPACSGELTTLKCHEPALSIYEFHLNERGETNYSYVLGVNLAMRDGEDVSYRCPRCGVELTKCENEATAILKGKVVPGLAARFAELAFSGEHKE